MSRLALSIIAATLANCGCPGQPGDSTFCGTNLFCTVCPSGYTDEALIDACASGLPCGGYCVATCSVNSDCDPSCQCFFTPAQIDAGIGRIPGSQTRQRYCVRVTPTQPGQPPTIEYDCLKR